MNFYKHYIGDFQRDTSHLTMTERGAYLALIQHYYATENCLPNDHKSLCRIAGAMTKPERDAVKVVMSFFEEKPEGLWHKRIEAELEKTDGRRDTNRAIALAREAKKRAKNEHETSTNRAEFVDETYHENSTIPEPEPDTRQKQYSVESDEGGVVINSESSRHHARVIPIADRFSMFRDWVPSDQFSEQLVFTPLRNGTVWITQLPEFVLYWAGKPEEKQNQFGWENKFLKNLLANQVHQEANLS